MIPTIVLASRNRKKEVEFARLLQPHNVQLVSVAEFAHTPEVEETGDSFAANAALKASQTATAVKRWALADDSGLMVDVLDGAPGIRSAHYAGPDATDADNNQQLLRAMAEIPPDRRMAQFVCHLAVADETGEIRLSVSAACRGVILATDRGSGGFGYDPLFLIREYDKTFGELSPLIKSLISHRARAFRRLIPQLIPLLREADVPSCP